MQPPIVEEIKRKEKLSWKKEGLLFISFRISYYIPSDQFT